MVERIKQVNLKIGRIGIGHGRRLSDGVDGHSLQRRCDLDGLIRKAIKDRGARFSGRTALAPSLSTIAGCRIHRVGEAVAAGHVHGEIAIEKGVVRGISRLQAGNERGTGVAGDHGERTRVCRRHGTGVRVGQRGRTVARVNGHGDQARGKRGGKDHIRCGRFRNIHPSDHACAYHGPPTGRHHRQMPVRCGGDLRVLATVQRDLRSEALPDLGRRRIDGMVQSTTIRIGVCCGIWV